MKLLVIILVCSLAIWTSGQDAPEPDIFEEWMNAPGSVYAGAECTHEKSTMFTGVLNPADQQPHTFKEGGLESGGLKSKLQVLDDLSAHFANRDGHVYKVKLNQNVGLERMLHMPTEGERNASRYHEEGPGDNRDQRRRRRPRRNDDNDDDEEEDSDKRLVFSPDLRMRLTPTTIAPSKYVVKLSIGCSGMIIGPRHILTAGHCIHSGGPNGDWMWSDWVAPAKDGAIEPYGRFTPVWMVSVTGWTVNEDYDHDYGLIRVDRDFATAGLMGWEQFGFNLFLGTRTTVYLRGYPGDKGGETMWWTSGRLSRTTSRRLYSNVYDTTGGSSGSGVYSYWVPLGSRTRRRIVHATHSGWNRVCTFRFFGICFRYQTFNRATRITPATYLLYCSWTGVC